MLISVVDALGDFITNPMNANHLYKLAGINVFDYTDKGCFLWVPYSLDSKRKDRVMRQIQATSNYDQKPPPGDGSLGNGGFAGSGFVR